MSDDLNTRGPADATRVNVNDSWKVRRWRENRGCTEQQLRECVKRVGVDRFGRRQVRGIIAHRDPSQ